MSFCVYFIASVAPQIHHPKRGSDTLFAPHKSVILSEVGRALQRPTQPKDPDDLNQPIPPVPFHHQCGHPTLDHPPATKSSPIGTNPHPTP
jgi:hypothetical protein